MKKDPYKHKEKYLAWKERYKHRIAGISKRNSDIALHYLENMEAGINIAQGSVKGSRSYSRLMSLKNRVVFFSKKFKEHYNLDDITKIKEEQLIEFFSNLKNGVIKREDGENFKSVGTYAKVFKAFWHWWMKINKRKGVELDDITLDLDTKQEKPKWVYLTEEQVRKLCDNAKFEYKIFIMFLFDTGIRAPTELLNVKVSDFFNDFKELNIREEISKTFGRRIKLMLCSELVKEYIKVKKLRTDDYLFDVTPCAANQYLKRIAKKVLGEEVSEAGQKYSDVSMYDFRHCSCCYWLPRYKSESALKYRFGWKKSDKIHYYSELLGMKDTIAEEDMLIDTTKTEIEQRLLQSEKKNEILQDRITNMEKYMQKLMNLADKLHLEIEVPT